MLATFLNTSLAPLGYNFLSFQALVETVLNAVSLGSPWYFLLNPAFILSFIAHLAVFYGVFYICFILPFRYFKYVLKVPDKKGRKE